MTTHLFALGNRAKTIVVIAALLSAALVITDPAAARTPSRGTTVLVQGTGMSATPSVRVRALQRALVRRGYDLGRWGVDGRFGPATAGAVRAFQARSGLAVDGIVGRATRGALHLRTTSTGRTEHRAPRATTAPKTTAPKTAAPKTAAPKTAAPKTAAPKTTAPKTTAPKTAAPKTRDRKPAPAGERDAQRPSTTSTPSDTRPASQPPAVNTTKPPTPAEPTTAAPQTSRNPWLLPIALGIGAALLVVLAASYALALASSIRDRIGRRVHGAGTVDRPGRSPSGPLALVPDAGAVDRVMVRADETRDSALRAGDRVIGYVPAGPSRPANGSDAAGTIRRACRTGEWTLLELIRDRHTNGDGPPPALILILERIDRGEASALVVGDLDHVRRPNGDAHALSAWLVSRGARLVVHDVAGAGRAPAAAITLEHEQGAKGGRARAG